MKTSILLFAITASVAVPLLAVDPPNGSVASAAPNADQIHFFETRIRPLLADHCYDCHNEETQESELRLDTLAGMLAGGNAGPPIIAGKPSSSLLLTAVSHRDSELRMPPGEKLSDRQIADLTRWIEMGAPHPDRGKSKIKQPSRGIDIEAGRQHWAFRPITKPDVPRSIGAISSPIDAFIAEEQKRHQLTPLGRADKWTLIRRATYDLTGLPPTPQEVHSFLADNSQDAFSRVVDRLLQSPHYGERWGRHWLDVARYADSNGLDENAAHGNAWRYRDYVVQAFNVDLPYDQFLTEQLAGDLLDSGDNTALKYQRLIATGYLMLGPKVLAEVDAQKMEMDIVDEQIDTIGRGLMSLTLGCARCHDHKFDPLEHEDYYALAGIFKSTHTMDSFKVVAKWNEVPIPTQDDTARKAKHDRRVSSMKQRIDDLVANDPQALASDEIEKTFPKSTQAKLKKLRAELKTIEETEPKMPTAMAVADGTVADVAMHIRGSHLTLGETVPRRFPRVLAGDDQPELPRDQSGRLEFARWLTGRDHPLTARVMVNRIWRWHFGKGLVATVDNFGMQGEPPTHPKLLDWLAWQFIEGGWSIKAMHRQIMLSETYQRSSDFHAGNAAADVDNHFYWRADVRRLEAEAIRDALLLTSGMLDRKFGGPVLEIPNRKLVFNHTSEDKSDYEIWRRSIYVPVIRNHLYDMFQLFDYTDASVLSGDRDTSTLTPQALFLMNSGFVTRVTAAMSERLLASESKRNARITMLFTQAYGRPPSDDEARRVTEFLTQFEKLSSDNESADTIHAWQALCQSIVSSSEFVYLR